MVTAILAFGCSNEDVEPLCIAPPNCGAINPDLVNFTISNNTSQDILGYEILRTTTEPEHVRLSPISTGLLSCWYSFDIEGISAIKVTLDGEVVQEDIELDLSNMANLQNGGTYWIEVSDTDGENTLSITPYDPTVCNDTEDN